MPNFDARIDFVKLTGVLGMFCLWMSARLTVPARALTYTHCPVPGGQVLTGSSLEGKPSLCLMAASHLDPLRFPASFRGRDLSFSVSLETGLISCSFSFFISTEEKYRNILRILVFLMKGCFKKKKAFSV